MENYNRTPMVEVVDDHADCSSSYYCRLSHYNAAHFRPTTTPPHASTSALSKLPLQFSLLVDRPIPSCQEGLYIPRFVYPTPQNGERIYAEINKEVDIRVKAQAIYAKIHGIIMSGLINVNKHKTTHDEFVMRWIPRPEDAGGHYTLCFAVESQNNQIVYQSEMRCVLLDAHNETLKVKVTCTESSMRVEVEKTSLHGIHIDHLRLSDPGNIECSLQRHSNSTHVIAVIPLNACGTQVEEDDENLIFKNEINTLDNPYNIITRKHRLEVDFHCQYPKRGNVTQSFNAHRKTITVWEKGFGMFIYLFEFYQNDQFQNMISPSLYPLVYILGSRIYMKIEASSSINSTELFVESCRAAPYDNPNFRPTYSIIENGCAVDPTVQIYYPAHEHEFRFSIEAFHFIGLHDHVYISCSVLMCEAGNAYTRCSQGCINTTWTDTGHRRKKRAVIQTPNHFVSQGPLRLQKSPESNESTVTNFNLNLIFIAGSLLAIFGMISTVVMYKIKMSSLKYQRLPTSES
ncbi:LOW QUALITY PROTEIN: ZP domain-containing protein-like [Syngnathoides biaculeatus]|uniref:LOW QUALITY PROTEIN: ZP domain-containing protein-like n=1 Tax=Syngnathoides biaculeatus TaxID=300417 RepID=UPI002ADE1F5A|nr:LOW QUALITY PROTEIN: ZP domain-containing protein-like [Syngnathoides biaculeatus]